MTHTSNLNKNQQTVKTKTNAMQTDHQNGRNDSIVGAHFAVDLFAIIQADPNVSSPDFVCSTLNDMSDKTCLVLTTTVNKYYNSKKTNKQCDNICLNQQHTCETNVRMVTCAPIPFSPNRWRNCRNFSSTLPPTPLDNLKKHDVTHTYTICHLMR